MKRFFLAFLATLVITAAGSFVIHGVLLKPLYLETPQLLRNAADSQAHAPFLLASFLAFSFGSVWIFWKHVRPVAGAAGAGAGLSYGLGLWLIWTVSHYVTDFAVAPWPSRVALLQMGLELPLALLVGVVIAAVLGRGER